MHEASLVQSLLEQVQTLMRDHQAQRVQTIQLSVGEFSGVEPELLRSAYDLLVDQTPVRGAPAAAHRPAAGRLPRLRAEIQRATAPVSVPRLPQPPDPRHPGRRNPAGKRHPGSRLLLESRSTISSIHGCQREVNDELQQASDFGLVSGRHDAQ